MNALQAPAATPSRVRPAPSQRSGPKAITIGLDFGTHSTKILLRPRGADNATLLRIDESHQAYPWFASPSLVRVTGGKVYLGSKTLEMSGGTLYRSLKVQLLPPEDGDAPDQSLPTGLTPDLLVAWYLSWVMGRIKLAVDRHYRFGDLKLALNVAAPMNHIESESLKTRYLGIVQAAWESAFGDTPFPVQQGMAVEELVPQFAPWIEKEVPGRETRPFEVLPETVAPIVSLSFDPRMDPGMYMIIDMGAGTTELSGNHVGEPGADQRVLCYEDQSIRFGGDNFEWLERNCDDPRRSRERMCRLVERFMKAFRRTWYVGYQKDAPNRASRERWRRLHVLLTGGAARRPEIEKAIGNALPMSPWPVGEQSYHFSWHQPTGIDLGEQDDTQLSALLAVAHGLSVPRQQWPVFFMPGQVDVQDAHETIEHPPAYWYVD